MPRTVTERNPAVSLTDSWQFATDPTDDGEGDAWYDPDATWTDARDVSVPHSWQEHDDLVTYTGVAWYRRTFELDHSTSDERVFLSFGAVDYETDVWINGRHVGDNEGGYLPFAVDATEAITPGENTVVLRVSDPEDLSELPHGKQGEPWYTRVSGPWQPVDVVTVPETHVESVRVSPDLEDDTATFAVDIADVTSGVELTVSVSRDGSVVAEETVEAGDDVTATVSIPDADYWTPDDPALYDYELTLTDGGEVVDRFEDYFGMRSVSTDDDDIYLNGEPFAMRGALDQAYYPDTYYRPADLATYEQEIRAAKELGFNLLRKHIKPAHPKFIELADRLGMLVWEEPANPKRYTEASKRRLEAQLWGMIERDYNSPSVIVWSIYNEEWGIGHADEEEPLWTDVAKQDYLESLYHETRAEDPTRLVCDNSGWAHVATDLNDYHEYFVVPDRLDAWRDRLDEIVDTPGGNYGDARTDPSEAPLLVSEFGTWGLPHVSSLLDHYGEEPNWFAHDFLDGLKRPAGVRERFAESHLSNVFDSLDDLATAWQTRELQSIETLIADMRVHDGVSGYVITEFTDIEWEFNGILDYLREEKTLDEGFARINGPVMYALDFDSHVAWSGEELTADLVVVNDTAEQLDTTVSISSPDVSDTTDVAVDIGGHESLRVEDAVRLTLPTVDAVASFEVVASTADDDRVATGTVYVGPQEGAVTRTAVYAENDRLRTALADRGYETVDDAASAAVSLVTDPDAVEGDGATLVVPDERGDLAETGLETVEIAKAASWNLCASFVYQDLLPGLDRVPGWAFEDVYPYGYVSDPDPEDDVSIGYTEGWLGTEGAIALVRAGEDTGVCTLRVTDSYGDHPVATAVCDQLIERLTS